MRIKEKYSVAAVRVALATLAGVAAGAAWADDTTQAPPEKIEKVLVTGSNIKRVDTETASPMEVITADDIRRQGLTNMADLINNLTTATGGLSDINGSNSFSPGGSYTSMRNLGAQATLVLVNGRRMPTYALADFTTTFTNLDAIPIDAVERVDVLKVGASSVYGSDAVAGVINIITRQNFEGLVGSVDRTQSANNGHFGQSKASLTGGIGNYDKDGYNVLLTGELYKRDNVMWEPLLQYTNPALTKLSPSFGTFSSYSYPGNIIDGASTQPVAGCAAKLIIGGLCKYDRYSRFQAEPESDRAQFASEGTLNLGNGKQGFAEVLYSKIKTKYLSAFPIYGDGQSPAQWGDPQTGLPLTFNYLGLLASSPLNPTGDDGVGFRYRFTDAPSHQDVDSRQYRALAGVRGSYKDYDWEAAAGVMNSTTTTTQQGAFSSSGFIQEIGNYNNYAADLNPNVNLNFQTTDPNFFNQPNGYRPGQTNSAQVLNTLFPVFGYSGSNTQQFADAKISGPLFQAPGGDAQFALGGELRHEHYTISPSSNLATGDIVGYGISSADSSRTTEAIYGELVVPVVKSFELDGALRADKFPNLSAHFSPKVAFKFTPTQSLMLRGTVEHGFRAPNLIESANSLKFAFDSGTSDPQRCTQATNLANDLYNQANNPATPAAQVPLLVARAENVYAAACSFGLADEVKNNPQLKPETSTSYNLGVVFEPIKGYSLTVDYWRIDRQNTIGLTSTQQLLMGNVPPGTVVNRAPLNPAADPIFTAAEITAYGVTAGPLQSVVREMQNISEQKTSGVDLNFDTVTGLGAWGKLSILGRSTYNISYYDTSVSTLQDNLVGQYGMPKWVAYLQTAWILPTMTNGLRFNWTSSYALQDGQSDSTWSIAGCAAAKVTAAECRVGRAQTLDYFFSYTGFKNLTLSANVRNVFFQRAPADLRSFGVGGIIPTNLQDAQGRMLQLRAEYTFK